MTDIAAIHDVRCRWCAGRDLSVVLDLGAQPPADLFPLLTDPSADPVWALQMAVCPRCGLAQLVEDCGAAEEPLGVEPRALVDQAEQAVRAVRASGLIGAGTTFAEFDSPHGGSWRSLLSAVGSVDHSDDAGPVDVVVDVFGLMHEADQRAALQRRIERIAPGGSLLLQFHSLESIVRQGQWNALRHGHLAYYSTGALASMLRTVGFAARRAWTFDLYGGTVLIEARAEPTESRAEADPTETDPTETDPTLGDLLARDRALHLSTPAGVSGLGERARAAAGELADWLTEQRAGGRTVIGYGAASRCVPLLVAAGVDSGLLSAVADASPAKHGRAIPGVRIPIISPVELLRRRPDVVLVFVPDMLDEIRAALPEVASYGGRWAVSEPQPRLVDPG